MKGAQKKNEMCTEESWVQRAGVCEDALPAAAIERSMVELIRVDRLVHGAVFPPGPGQGL